MGWFWSNETTKPPSPTAQPPPEPKEQPKATSADPEIEKFLALFQEDQKKPSEEQPSSSSPKPRFPSTNSTPSKWFSWPSSQPTAGAPPSQPNSLSSTSSTSDTDSDPSALAASLLPTTMNCRQAFDMAWSCQSPVGQWRAVYRYGTARDCSELWSDFWFCMRTKGHAGGAASREEAIRARYAAKEHAKYGPGMPSSEDVWVARGERVERGSVMNVPLEDLGRRGGS